MGAGGCAGDGWVPTCIRLFFVLMLYIKFQVPNSSGSLVSTETNGISDR